MNQIKTISMSNQIFNNKTFFKIYYCHNNKMYDFTVLDSHTKEIIYHYHFSNLNEINKLIQTYK
jgi:hypothetical protein